jgi:hypothetical protein
MRRLIIGIPILLLLGAAAPPDPQEQKVKFNRDIRPILANACFQCHGPDPAARKAKLRFDREEGYFGQREGGPTVVKGKPEASPLYQRLIHADPEEVMPPPKSKKVLKPAEKELIKKWIAQGAPWEAHWSFIKPERPTLPTVKNEKWVRTPIDRFVLARLESAGLSPAPEADRRTLARRLSLDLVGLPPEPEQVEAFANDPAPDAYEKLVDKLLASPRYGEHRARYWLDAARYGDTHGLHFDNFREIWPYRDWVIAAFNRNLTFDKFTVEQIAGDLLPEPTKDQILATGFHRCAITTNEGGSIAEEVLFNYARERVETTAWVWLGLTANCAVCHDHKFDPITQKDFYSMSAYFRNTTQGAMDGNIRDTAPVMVLPKMEDEKRWNDAPAEIEARKKEVAERRRVLRAGFDHWLVTAQPEDWEGDEKAGKPSFHLPLDAEQPADAVAGSLDEKVVLLKASAALQWADSGRGPGKTLVLDGKSVIEAPGEIGALEHNVPFSYGAWVKINPGFQGSASVFARMDDDLGFRGWDLWVQGNEFAAHLVHKWKDDALKVATTGNRVKPGTWQHVFVTHDGTGKAAGFRIFVDGREAKLATEVDTLKSSPKVETPLVVGRRKKSGQMAGASVQDIRIYRRKLSSAEVLSLATHARAQAILAKPHAQRQPKERDELFDLLFAGDAVLSQGSERIAALEAERKTIRDRSSVAYIQEERKGSMPTANILFRGEYDKPRDKVEAGVFSALHPLPADAPKSRLGLAQWLVSKENPLAARVTVNRFWQEVFGTGLVKSSEDFGIMGESPSHPELLDWLAVEFREGWDVKKLMRLMVTSAAYRQSAAATKEKVEKDPANRLLSRGPRFRMDAEMIRDAALSASGLLSGKVGGPSVKPYQPEGVWEAVGMREGNTKIYKRDTGEALYRRSLYTFWKRMAPPASMEILNAPAREFSCLRRERTNTPLQALVTLNDPQFVEAARALAEGALKSGAADDAARIQHVARRVLSRPLSGQETPVVTRVLGTLRAHYKAQPEDAKKLIAVGETKADPAVDPSELAAWTMVANQLMNLDEVLNK